MPGDGCCVSSKLRQAVNSSNQVRAPERTLCYKSGPMVSFFNGFLTCLNAFFRSRYNIGLEIPARCVGSGACRRLESTELLGGFQEAASARSIPLEHLLLSAQPSRSADTRTSQNREN